MPLDLDIVASQSTAPGASSTDAAQVRSISLDWPAPTLLSLDGVELDSPVAASIRIVDGAAKVSSYRFEPFIARRASLDRQAPRAMGMTGSHRQPSAGAASVVANRAPRASSRTRCRPPRDMVRLQDRLFYVLQPPVETLLETNNLMFPHQPFPHQFAGIGFLLPRSSAVLADEMGLGKTMQAITAIRLLVHSGMARDVLLVCPKPLMTLWVTEFRCWAPELIVAAIEGDGATRNWLWSQSSAVVKIVNYELLARDQELWQGSNPFDLVVLDEAQRIKNRGSLTNRAVTAIPRRRSWALTGTPIENSTHDLVGIFDFVARGVIHEGMSPLTMAEEASEYILRRTKQQVLKDLPPRLDRDADLELTDAQRRTYDAAENDGVVALNSLGHHITIRHVFELVIRLKQICNFDPATGASSKMERLHADLAEVTASGQKAIIFSQWVATLEHIGRLIPQCHPLAFHGRIPTRQRDQVLEEFRRDPRRHVLLVSYGAGSVGLNLQFCRYVFLFDRWWNPAVEDQAINRAHRLGSVGSVTVTRLSTIDTIEQRINAILMEKRQLFQTLLPESQHPHQLGLTRDDVFGLFPLRSPPAAVKVA
jgi:SNF2 family DNA or RNA helicase